MARTLNDIQAASSLTIGILVSVNGSIAFNVDHGTVCVVSASQFATRKTNRSEAVGAQ